MFITVEPVNKDGKTKSKILNDCINHTNDWERMMVRGSLTTSTHECLHQIHADIRNDRIIRAVGGELDSLDGTALWQPDPTYKKPYTGPGENGFYLLNNKVFKCKEPKLRKSQAADFIPNELRGFRFRTYITGQTAWDDTPLYIFDEWNAYCGGTECAIELNSLGDSSPRGTDISSGPIEFMMYSMGLVLAIQKHDKGYFDREPNFLPFCRYQAARALKIATECNQYFPWDATTKYLNLWNQPICKQYRDLVGTKKLTLDDFIIE